MANEFNKPWDDFPQNAEHDFMISEMFRLYGKIQNSDNISFNIDLPKRIYLNLGAETVHYIPQENMLLYFEDGVEKIAFNFITEQCWVNGIKTAKPFHSKFVNDFVWRVGDAPTIADAVTEIDGLIISVMEGNHPFESILVVKVGDKNLDFDFSGHEMGSQGIRIGKWIYDHYLNEQ